MAAGTVKGRGTRDEEPRPGAGLDGDRASDRHLGDGLPDGLAAEHERRGRWHRDLRSGNRLGRPSQRPYAAHLPGHCRPGGFCLRHLHRRSRRQGRRAGATQCRALRHHDARRLLYLGLCAGKPGLLRRQAGARARRQCRRISRWRATARPNRCRSSSAISISSRGWWSTASSPITSSATSGPARRPTTSSASTCRMSPGTTQASPTSPRRSATASVACRCTRAATIARRCAG